MRPPLPNSPILEWFEKRFHKPTPPQAGAWPRIAGGANVLIISPTGTGKTFAAFLSVLNQLAIEHAAGKLKQQLRAIYVSPLRALSYDLEKNLKQPLTEVYGSAPPIHVGLRSGDTSSGERQKQFDRPPHILLTTPESLSLLLTQKKWQPTLETVQWLIVDEIHAMAENKRGAHLSISMERLADLVAARGTKLQRIGLSATVAPVEDASRFLVGTNGACEIIDTSAAKKIDMRVYSPLGKNPYPPSGYTGERLIAELGRLVQANRTTLVFTNTRSGAEAATFWLQRALPELSDQIECHHASLGRDVRQEVEDRLKRGELRAVVCSTSLELGIDIGSVDLVVMLSTPKGVSRALQRTGRAGHNINTVSRGLIMATNLNDLVECCATVLLARTRQLDPIRIPRAPLDVLAQHLASMGCIRRWNFDEALTLVRRAYPYRDLRDDEFRDVIDYLAGGGKSLRHQYSELFGKIHLDETSFETRTGITQRDLLQNLGVIPNEGVVSVRLKSRTLGSIEETFLRNLNIGDVFIIAGRAVKLERVGMMEVFVSKADHATPTVPRWNANKMPLTNKVAEEIVAFRGEIRAQIESKGANDASITPWVAERLDCGQVNADLIHQMYAAQHALSEIPTADFLLVEEYVSQGNEGPPEEEVLQKRKPMKRRLPARMPTARHYFFHCLIGRAGNEALSRVLALRISRLRGGNAVATPDDYGFVLTVTATQKISEADLAALLSPQNFAEDLNESLSRSDLLKYHFRNAAQAGLMVYRNFFGEQKSVRKLQWSAEVIFNVLNQYEPDHVLLREARRDAVHTYLDLDGALAYLQRMQNLPARLKPVWRVPPLSFALFVTKIKEALLVEDPRAMTERLFNLWWDRINEQQPEPGG
ncbi:MAG TPA: DEAD/DEAH box helicase [Verrucomicrobiae bacterium]